MAADATPGFGGWRGHRAHSTGTGNLYRLTWPWTSATAIGAQPSFVQRGSSELGVWLAQATSPCMDQYRPVGDLGRIGTTRRDAMTGCYGLRQRRLKPSRTRAARQFLLGIVRLSLGRRRQCRYAVGVAKGADLGVVGSVTKSAWFVKGIITNRRVGSGRRKRSV